MNDFNAKNFQPVGNKDITELKKRTVQDLQRLKLNFEIMIAGCEKYINYNETGGQFFKDEKFNTATVEIEKWKLGYCQSHLQLVVNEIISRNKNSPETSLN
ncbi:hypothetical protein [uncultured Draconibacterium sp.]|uniref:hypothetical protein n=1 Tax=uncultured Draconibacterium sp. TaxID=1573823 RepID=UPI0026276CAA|nr:hypothetical protein [uncultured Draconibacterium sp.]